MGSNYGSVRYAIQVIKYTQSVRIRRCLIRDGTEERFLCIMFCSPGFCC
ncbi:unnamed protein product [Periconia digitata]|uniref:Uncharacterized protein n=1 Tax=Periconia digitata TaxID=1303443 RepID=A0A9W4XQZ1_9PLEO|nr:unnamed protein product [Periconia digitata]